MAGAAHLGDIRHPYVTSMEAPTAYSNVFIRVEHNIAMGDCSPKRDHTLWMWCFEHADNPSWPSELCCRRIASDRSKPRPAPCAAQRCQ
eukprot:6195876-Pleurochrysis_carterae.AAC.2